MYLAELKGAVAREVERQKALLCRRMREDGFFLLRHGVPEPLDPAPAQAWLRGAPGVVLDAATAASLRRTGAQVWHAPGARAALLDTELAERLSLYGGDVFLVGSRLHGANQLVGPVVVEGCTLAGARVAGHAHCRGSALVGAEILSDCLVEEGCYVNAGTRIAHGVRLERYAQVGPGCTLIAGTFERHRTLLHRLRHAGAPEPVIEVGTHAWLGAHVSVVRGVRVGRWSVVAAGTVVRRDLAPHRLLRGAEEEDLIDPYAGRDDLAQVVGALCREGNPHEEMSPAARVYNRVQRRLAQGGPEDEADARVRLHYLYAHSNLLRRVLRAGGRARPVVFDEFLFDAFTPERVDIDLAGRRLEIRYAAEPDPRHARVAWSVTRALCAFADEVWETGPGRHGARLGPGDVQVLRECERLYDEEIHAQDESERNG